MRLPHALLALLALPFKLSRTFLLHSSLLTQQNKTEIMDGILNFAQQQLQNQSTSIMEN